MTQGLAHLVLLPPCVSLLSPIDPLACTPKLSLHWAWLLLPFTCVPIHRHLLVFSERIHNPELLSFPSQPLAYPHPLRRHSVHNYHLIYDLYTHTVLRRLIDVVRYPLRLAPTYSRSNELTQRDVVLRVVADG
jgi:hypothetical protein